MKLICLPHVVSQVALVLAAGCHVSDLPVSVACLLASDVARAAAAKTLASRASFMVTANPGARVRTSGSGCGRTGIKRYLGSC